jgi:hypothetical protein
MRWDLALALRLLVHTAAVILGIGVTLLGLAAITIALFGTGGFTADPPPNHPNLIAALGVVVLCVVLECALYWTWRKLVGVLDAAEAK